MSDSEHHLYEADVIDPVTGEVTTVTADTEAALDVRIDEVLTENYGEPESEPAPEQ